MFTTISSFSIVSLVQIVQAVFSSFVVASVLVPALEWKLVHVLHLVVRGEKVEGEGPAPAAAQVQGAQLRQLGVAQGEIPHVKVLANAVLEVRRRRFVPVQYVHVRKKNHLILLPWCAYTRTYSSKICKR